MTENKDHYAIVIGIDTYHRLFRLRSAQADATAFAAWLKKKDGSGGGLPDNQVLLLLGPDEVPSDLSSPKPVQFHIDDQLDAWGIRENKRIGKRLYFYFAGHGFGAGFDNVGMLMINAQETDIDKNIGLWQYRQYFRTHYIFDEIVYIIDCCRDPVPRVPYQLQRPSFNIMEKRAEVREYVVLATPYGGKAYAPRSKDKGRRQGLLTSAILEGFEKASDDSYRVTSDTLRSYILTRFPKLVDELHDDRKVDKKLKRQMPEIMALPYPPLYFNTIPPNQLLRVHIIAGPGQKGHLTLYDGEGNQLATHATKDATATQPWEVELDRNRFVYMVEHSAGGEPISIQPKFVTKEPHIVRINT